MYRSRKIAMTRQKFHPTNGSDEMMIADYCADCLYDEDDNCPLLYQSIAARSLDQMPDEWTAEDCSGAGFRCANYKQREEA